MENDWYNFYETGTDANMALLDKSDDLPIHQILVWVENYVHVNVVIQEGGFFNN